MSDLIVIYYHEVVTKGKGYSYQKIEVDKFEEQMKYLYDNDYQTLLFSELNKSIPQKAVIVSFDDGFRTVFQNAAPIMERYHIKGNVYLPTHYIGREESFMTWDMVKKLQASSNFEFAAHTHHHVDIRCLNRIEIEDEITKSDMMFNEEIGYKPCAFCMPYGTYDKKSINCLKSINRYDYVLGSYYGTIKSDKLGKKVLPRIGISNDDSIEVFENKLVGKMNWKGSLQQIRLLVSSLKKQRIEEYQY